MKGKDGEENGEHAIRVDDGTLSVENATVNATGGSKTVEYSSGSSGKGIYRGTVKITNGTLNTIGGNGGTFSNGSYIGGQGAYNCKITVDGGTVNCTGGNVSNYTGSEDHAKPGDGGAGVNYGSVTVNKGTFTATGGATQYLVPCPSSKPTPHGSWRASMRKAASAAQRRTRDRSCKGSCRTAKPGPWM